MDLDSLNQHLSRISTLWSLLQQAHAGPDDAATAAQRVLMQRYLGAVYHYLLGALRDQGAAEELLQEFAARFLRGDFRRADPRRGRFRDYVKTALIHLVNDHRRAERARPGPLPSDLAGPSAADAEDDARRFLDSWREELLTQTWAALAEGHPTFFAVLDFHVRQPDVTSAQMAAELSTRLGKPCTAGQVRVTLHRARAKFAELLVEEVARSLGRPEAAELVQEIRDLDLLKYCRNALERY
jgi:DNA-directed RNA polymerase specialized sigma24 family protein